jgi:arylsulfate sulfotransferase
MSNTTNGRISSRTKRAVALRILLILSLFAGFDIASPREGTILVGDISLVLNPFGIAPLSARADFETTLKCSVQVRILGEEEVIKNFEEMSTVHSVPILGLYPDRANTVLVTLYTHHGTPETRTLVVRTDPLPAFLPNVRIDALQSGRIEPGMNASALSISIGSGRATYPFIFDRNGDIRWYLDLSQYSGSCLPFDRFGDGNFVFGLGDSFYEYDMLGDLKAKITKPGYNFHHDLKELPNGHFIACVDKQGTTIVNSRGVINSTGDWLIEIDRASGAVVTEWDLRQVLDVDRNEQINSNGDWFHMNGIWFSAADDCIIISGRHQGVAKVTRNNQLKWILSPRQGWQTAGPDGSGPDTRPFLLTAVDASGNPYPDDIQNGISSDENFDWGWGQHSPMLLSSGNLFIFDNGDFRNFIGFGPYSRAVEYRIDETDMTIRQIWDYGKNRGAELYSSIISDVDELPLSHNRFMAPGIVRTPAGKYAKVVELSYPEKTVVFEATLQFKNLLASPGTTFGDNIYRSRRISIYP